MSWILGCFSPNLTQEIRNRISAIHPDALHRFTTANLSIAAGGLKDTCLAGPFVARHPQNNFDTWIVCGLGIRKSQGHSEFLSSSDWQKILSDPQPDLRTLDGHFIILRLGQKTLEFFSDQLGLRTIYFAQRSNGIFFSTRLDWLANVSGDISIDFAALGSAWLTFNKLSYSSLLHNVQRLGPSGYARLYSSSIETHHSPWEPRSIPTEIEEAISHLEALSTPVEDAGRVTLGLSGGLDSRTLLAVLMRRNQSVSVHSFGDEKDPDVNIARQISFNEGASHAVFNETVPPAPDIITLMRDYAAEVPLCEPATSIIRLRSYSKLRGHAKLLVDGGFGELSRRQYLNRLLVKGKPALVSGNPSLILPHLSLTRANIFTRETLTQMKLGLLNEIETTWRTMPRIADVGFGNFLDLLAVRTRVPNWGGLDQARLDGIMLNYMPFVQPSFLQMVFSLSTNVRTNGKFFRQIIRKYKPSLKRYPLVKNNTTYPFWMTTFQSWLWTRVKTYLGKTYVDHSRCKTLDAIKDYVMDTVNSSSVKNFAPYNYAAIEGIAGDYYAGRKDLASQLGWWVTFELWRQSIGVN